MIGMSKEVNISRTVNHHLMLNGIVYRKHADKKEVMTSLRLKARPNHHMHDKKPNLMYNTVSFVRSLARTH